MAQPPALGERPNIVVVTLRRLGDVLLTTPLIATLRHAFPQARIDAVVFAGTESMLAGNPHVSHVIPISLKPRLKELQRVSRQLGQRYDIAISTQSGDRPIGLAAVMGRHSIGLLGPKATGRWWKRAVLSQVVEQDDNEHRVMHLAHLSDALGVPRVLTLVAPQGPAPSALFPQEPYVVFHANPMFPYRRWRMQGWAGLADIFARRGFRVVATGGPGADERAYLDEVWGQARADILRLDGKLDFVANSALLAGAKLYVGPDTSMSHLAAAAGCPMVAIYGPASPHEIGPWPSDAIETPWKRSGRIQRQGQVAVVQNPLFCLPCQRTGCDNHLRSHSNCLDQLPLSQVLEAADAVMEADHRLRLAKTAASTSATSSFTKQSV